MTNSEIYRRVAEMLSLADQHPDLEAARRGQKAQDEYHAQVISENNVGAATNVRTTALNLDMESLIAAARSKAETKAGQVSSQKCKNKEVTSRVINRESIAHSAKRIAVDHVTKRTKQKYKTKAMHCTSGVSCKMTQPMCVA